MNIALAQSTTGSDLPSLIDRASAALAGARNSAEILEARELASFAYDIAKRTARLAAAKSARDSLIAAAHRAQADALEIEAGANRRLADEYDAAQERGEVAAHGGDRGNQHVAKIPDQNVATAAQANVSPKEIFEARQIRNAEERELLRASRAFEIDALLLQRRCVRNRRF